MDRGKPSSTTKSTYELHRRMSRQNKEARSDSVIFLRTNCQTKRDKPLMNAKYFAVAVCVFVRCWKSFTSDFTVIDKFAVLFIFCLCVLFTLVCLHFGQLNSATSQSVRSQYIYYACLNAHLMWWWAANPSHKMAMYPYDLGIITVCKSLMYIDLSITNLYNDQF